MRSLILKTASFIFHPLWLPSYAMVYYFSYANFMYTYESMVAKIFAVIILSAILPILFLLFLKPLRLIDSLHLESVHQRKIPLLFFLSITALITTYVFEPIEYRIPFYFFSGVFVSGLICFLLTFIKHKISLHAVGISGLTTFIICFNIQYGLQGIGAVSICILATGWVLSSRLYMGAHSYKELLSGLLVGMCSQLIFLRLWSLL